MDTSDLWLIKFLLSQYIHFIYKYKAKSLEMDIYKGSWGHKMSLKSEEKKEEKKTPTDCNS